MAKNPLGSMWPSGTLNLREPRLGQPRASTQPKVSKLKIPKAKPTKLVSMSKLAPFKRFGAS